MKRDILFSMLHDMLQARAVEERAAHEYTQGHIAGFLHLYPGDRGCCGINMHLIDRAGRG
jgi:pyruvate dehydrogenase E1 component alpha subunit